MDIEVRYIEENSTLWAKHLFGPTWDKLERPSPDQKLWLIPQEVVNRMDEINTRGAELMAMDLIKEVRQLRMENLLLKRQNGQLHQSAPQDVSQLVEKYERLRQENMTLRKENFWLRTDAKPFDWGEDSMPWGFSDS